MSWCLTAVLFTFIVVGCNVSCYVDLDFGVVFMFSFELNNILESGVIARYGRFPYVRFDSLDMDFICCVVLFSWIHVPYMVFCSVRLVTMHLY